MVAYRSRSFCTGLQPLQKESRSRGQSLRARRSVFLLSALSWTPNHFPERRRGRAQVHGHIENRANGATEQFAHGGGHVLIVQSAKDPPPRSRVAFLHKLQVQTRVGEVTLMPGFDEETPFVLEIVDIDDDEIFERGLRQSCFHWS